MADYRVLIGTTAVVMLSRAAVLLTSSTAEPEPVPASTPAPPIGSDPEGDPQATPAETAKAADPASVGCSGARSGYSQPPDLS